MMCLTWTLDPLTKYPGQFPHNMDLGLISNEARRKLNMRKTRVGGVLVRLVVVETLASDPSAPPNEPVA